MEDQDSTRIVMEQALQGLFSRVRTLPHTEEDDVWISQFELGIREGWIDLLAAFQTRKEMNARVTEQMEMVLGALSDLVEMVAPEDIPRALSLVDELNINLQRVGNQ